MKTLKLDAPLETEEAQVALDPTLPPGRYVARLVVSGPSGKSAPAQVVITVKREQ